MWTGTLSAASPKASGDSASAADTSLEYSVIAVLVYSTAWTRRTPRATMIASRVLRENSDRV
jgi:hypothetical protein